MKLLVLVINGKPESGKDAFAGIIKKMFSNKTTYINNISTVDNIKFLAKYHFGWDGIRDEKGRRLLSDLKDASTRYNLGPFLTVTGIIDTFNKTYNEINNIWIIHSREPEDIQRFVDYYKENCKTILIKRDNHNINISNHADADVDCFDYDYILENNGSLEDFNNTCVNFIQTLGIFQ